MKNTSLTFLSLLLAAPLPCYAAEQLIPAGSLIQCTISEPKLSSRTVAVGDPVLCQVGYSELYGRSVLPYDSYLVGRFEDYKDPGHFVGKGWMELKFHRMVIEPDTVLPIHARVVGVPGYNVDRKGRILGKGHAVRDTVEWMIPILWPIDMINLPRRGPRPTLKEETRLTLKVMDDLDVPVAEPLQRDPSGLLRRAPSAYMPAPPEPAPQPVPAAPMYAPMNVMPSPGYRNAVPAVPSLAQAWWSPRTSTPSQYRGAYSDPGEQYPDSESQAAVTLVFNDGRPPEQIHNYMMTSTAIYVLDRYRRVTPIPLDKINMAATRRVNLDAGIDFRFPVAAGR